MGVIDGIDDEIADRAGKKLRIRADINVKIFEPESKTFFLGDRPEFLGKLFEKRGKFKGFGMRRCVSGLQF